MDTLDRDILVELQENGRRPNAEIARRLGVAPSTMLERIRRLEESGQIKGYRAIVSPEAIGLGVQAFISVSLERHDKEHIRHFEQGVQKIEGVRACYHLTGKLDYLLLLAVRDLAHLGEIVKEQIASIKGIGRVETFLVMSEVKEDRGWPIL